MRAFEFDKNCNKKETRAIPIQKQKLKILEGQYLLGGLDKELLRIVNIFSSSKFRILAPQSS